MPEPDVLPVSVVIPAFRSVATIGRALNSVRVQTRRPAEVIVVDDGSDDNTAAVAASWTDKLRPTALNVIQQDNAGAGAARNTGIRHAVQPLIAFLDADDEWLPEKLERSVDRLEAGGFTLVAHNGWIVAADGKTTLNDCARRFREPGDPYATLYRKGYIDTCTVVCRRDALLAAGGFDETLPNAQDFDMWLAVLAPADAAFEVFDEALARYHIVAGSIMSHVGRRLRCTFDVALRFLPALRWRRAGGIPDLLYRVTAIHFEAFTALRAQGRPFRAAGAASLYLVSLVRALARTLADDFPARSGGLSGGTPQPAVGRFWGPAALIWVAGAFAVYLVQFRDLLPQVLRALGLSG